MRYFQCEQFADDGSDNHEDHQENIQLWQVILIFVVISDITLSNAFEK